MKETKLFERVTGNETVTPRKHVTKYKYMRKWMVEFLSKSQSCGIKIANSHGQIYQFTLIYYVPFQSVTSSREDSFSNEATC